MSGASGNLVDVVVQALNGASRETLIKITQLLDQLPDRALAHQLSTMLGPQIASLKHDRKISLLRLLFQPFDPVIVPTGAWKAGDFTLPRVLVRPIGSWILDAMPEAAKFNEQLQAIPGGDHVEVEKLGHALWLSASKLVASGVPPATLRSMSAATNVAEEVIQASIESLGVNLECILAMRGNSPSWPVINVRDDRQVVQQCLTDIAKAGTHAWCVALALLISRCSDLGGMFRMARQIAAMQADENAYLTALDHVCDATFSRIEARAAEAIVYSDKPPQTLVCRHGEYRLSARDIMVTDALIRALSRVSMWSRRIAQLKQTMAKACLVQFEFQVREELLSQWPRQAWPDELMNIFETGLREMHAFASAAAALSGAEGYRTLMQRVADRYSDDKNLGLTVGERIRAVSILLDVPTAAMLLPSVGQSVF